MDTVFVPIVPDTAGLEKEKLVRAFAELRTGVGVGVGITLGLGVGLAAGPEESDPAGLEQARIAKSKINRA